eukprot:SAG25_NODE_1879_length_2216_cov_1.687293_3_plen_197_part_00
MGHPRAHPRAPSDPASTSGRVHVVQAGWKVQWGGCGPLATIQPTLMAPLHQLAVIVGLMLGHHVLPVSSASTPSRSGNSGRDRRRERSPPAGAEHLVVTLSGTTAPDGAELDAKSIALYDEPKTVAMGGTPIMFVPQGAVLRFPKVGATLDMYLVPLGTAQQSCTQSHGMYYHCTHAPTCGQRAGGGLLSPAASHT